MSAAEPPKSQAAEPPKGKAAADEAAPVAPAQVRVAVLDGMPAWLPRAMVVGVLIFGAFVASWWLLGRLRGLLIMLLLAQFLALALEPAVNWLAARGWRRGAATGFVMLVVLIVLGGFAVAIGSLVVSQVATLAEQAPDYAEDLLNWINRTFDANLSTARIRDQLTAPEGPLGNYSQRIAEGALGLGTATVGILFQFLTVLLFAFYLCADGPRVRRGICSMLTPARQRDVLRAWEIAIDKTGGYLYSRLLLGLVSGLAHYAVLFILDVPYAVALALWIGAVSQLVPTVGTYIGAVLPLVVALVNSPTDALILLIFIVIYQQIENYLLQPRITARTLDLHPAVAFGAVIAGASVLGAVGAILAIPFTAVVQTFVGSYIRRYEVEDHALVEREESAD